MVEKCVKVSWRRKAYGEKEIWFDKESSYDICNVREVKVTKKQFDKIINTLDDLPRKVLNEVKQVKAGKWGYSKAVIVKFGRQRLAIDTQGYDYPRYKSKVVKK